MAESGQAGKGCAQGCLLSIVGSIVLSILVLILRQCAGLSNEVPDETGPAGAEVSPKQREAQQARVTADLALNNPAMSEEIFAMLDAAVSFRQQAMETRTKAVKAESADLIKKIEESTGGGFSQEQAIELLDNMTPGQAHDAAMDASQRNIAAMMDRAAKKLESEAGLSEYEARKRVVKAFNGAWPDHARYFPPHPILAEITDAPPAPPASGEYAMLMYLEKKFWEHELYHKLEKLKPEEMPDDALMVLLYLDGLSIPTGVRRDGWVIEPHSMIQRYGNRACGGVIRCMTHPATCKRTFEQPPIPYLRYLRECPEDVRKEVLSAAMQSGWRAAENYLPGNEPWADPLFDNYEDSPYGPPARNPDERPLTVQEQQLIDARMKDFETEFNKRATGRYNGDFALRRTIQEELDFDKRKLSLAFGNRINEYMNEYRKLLMK